LKQRSKYHSSEDVQKIDKLRGSASCILLGSTLCFSYIFIMTF